MMSLISLSQRQMLQNQMQKGILSHAYLFHGAHSDKLKVTVREFLYEIAINGNSCEPQLLRNRVNDGMIPDILEIDEDSKSIKIDSIRNIISFLSIRPQELKNRIAVIYNASDMTEQAQNALLKTLEEPAGGAVIVLASSSESGLLNTIISRVMEINVFDDNSQTKTDIGFLIQRIEQTVLMGDVAMIFSTADSLSKDKGKLKDYLTELHKIFGQIASDKITENDGRCESIRVLSENMSAQCAINMQKIIMDTLRYINQNASALLALEVMMIRLQEEFNAENSWNTI